jgi:hypothetical protein
MPQTVPKSPTKGAVLPTEASSDSPRLEPFRLLLDALPQRPYQELLASTGLPVRREMPGGLDRQARQAGARILRSCGEDRAQFLKGADTPEARKEHRLPPSLQPVRGQSIDDDPPAGERGEQHRDEDDARRRVGLRQEMGNTQGAFEHGGTHMTKEIGTSTHAATLSSPRRAGTKRQRTTAWRAAASSRSNPDDVPSST